VSDRPAPVRHVVLLTYGEPPTPRLLDHLTYSWRILLGLTRTVAPIPGWLLPVIAVSRAAGRHRLWRRERYGSPLEAVTRAQAAHLAAALAAFAPPAVWRVHVAYEFRDPLLADVLTRLPADEPVDVLPMYVADSAFTHGLSRLTVAEWLRRAAPRRPAPVRVLGALDAETLGELEARHVAAQLAGRQIETGPEWALVLAAHGTLLDPPVGIETGRGGTEAVCAALARRLAPRFGRVVNGWLNHARGGRWTEPTVAEALRQVAEAGFRKVVYFPFGFSADNAESQLEGRVWLRAQPGLQAVHLPCLNDAPALAATLARALAKAEGPA
jgi:protoheme ferro-lyase